MVTVIKIDAQTIPLFKHYEYYVLDNYEYNPDFGNYEKN